jgi:energy-coupling factor transport system permease protein
MQNKLHASAFAGCNPVINFALFIAILIITICFLQPVLLGISFVAATLYAIYLNGRRAVVFSLAFLLPLMLVAAVFNPLFNHAGVTMLFYFLDNPVTLEAILYGLAAALMIGAVIQWFSCYNALITSDKFLYLFGRIIPALAMVISMALRFIPHYKAQIQRISLAQRGLGLGVASGNLLTRARQGMSIISIMVTWALENGVETADSMRARGYGLPGRSHYSNFRFEARDWWMLALIVVFTLITVVGLASSTLYISYFPMLVTNDTNGLVLLVYAAYAALCFLPLALDLREELVWRKLRRGDHWSPVLPMVPRAANGRPYRD